MASPLSRPKSNKARPLCQCAKPRPRSADKGRPRGVRTQQRLKRVKIEIPGGTSAGASTHVCRFGWLRVSQIRKTGAPGGRSSLYLGQINLPFLGGCGNHPD